MNQVLSAVCLFPHSRKRQTALGTRLKLNDMPVSVFAVISRGIRDLAEGNHDMPVFSNMESSIQTVPWQAAKTGLPFAWNLVLSRMYSVSFLENVALCPKRASKISLPNNARSRLLASKG